MAASPCVVSILRDARKSALLRMRSIKEKARSKDRALIVLNQGSYLSRFVRDGGIVAIGVRIGFTVGFDLGLRLGAAARALGELAFDFLHRLGFRPVLHDGDFPRQAIERRFIELTFAVGLFGLR